MTYFALETQAGHIIYIYVYIDMLYIFVYIYIYYFMGLRESFVVKALDGQINISSLCIFHIHSPIYSYQWSRHSSILTTSTLKLPKFRIQLSRCPLRGHGGYTFMNVTLTMRRHVWVGVLFLKPSCFQSL